LRGWWWRGLFAALAALWLVLLSAAPVIAAEIKGGPTLTIGRDEVLYDDLFAWGGAVTVDGAVYGDVFAAGGSVAINGTVEGSVAVAGGTVTVSGEVSRALRVACGLARIDGKVAGDVMLLGRNLVVGREAQVGGNLYMAVRDAQLAGTVAGKVNGAATRLTISGLVNSDINISVDTLVIKSTAVIKGDLYYSSDKEVETEPGAKLLGVVTRRPPEPVGKELTRAASLASLIRDRVVTYLMALVLGVAVLFLFPRRSSAASESLRSRPWASLGWGALLFLLVPAAVVAVGLTIIGLPLALISLALYGITLYLTQIVVSLTIGSPILERLRPVRSKGMQVAALALGLAILELVRSIPLPYWGWGITLLIFLFGLGAILVSERELVEHGR